MDHDAIFTVVIPLFNKQAEIRATLESVLSQTFSRFEVIIVDDGSTDCGPAIVEGYDDPRVRLISQVNSGVSKARNVGWQNANSHLIAFLDADDVWDVDFLETMARLVAEFPECAAFGLGYRRLGNNNIDNKIEAGLRRMGRGIIGNYFRAATNGDQPFFTSTVCVRASVLRDLDGFRNGVSHGEDLDLWGRIALGRQIAFDAEQKATYRLMAENRAMGRCPPLGWVFRSSFESADEGQFRGFSRIDVQRHVEHIELYHAYLNLGHVSGRAIRSSIAGISWFSFPLRKARIWVLSYIVSS